MAEQSAAMVTALNRATCPLALELGWLNASFTEVETVDPYHPNVAQPYDPAKPLLIAPGAIVTLTSVPLGQVPQSLLAEVESPAKSASGK